VKVAIRWQTGALTTFGLPRLKKTWEERQTDPRAVALIRRLAPDHTDQEIATHLNEKGLNAGRGGAFTRSKVEFIRWAYHIATGCPEQPGACPSGQRGDGRYSAQKAAELLNVHVSTISEWCKRGRLDGISTAPMGPRWIKMTPEMIAELRKPVRRHWSRPACGLGRRVGGRL